MRTDRPPSDAPRPDPLDAPWPEWRLWLVVDLTGWAMLLALLVWGGGDRATLGAAAVLAALLGLWGGLMFGMALGGANAGLLALVIGLSRPWIGLAGAAGIGAGLVAAALGGGLVRRWRLAVRQRMSARDAELAALRAALDEARGELARLKCRLSDAERLATVGTMSAQIAHQLRNPLTSIGLYIQLVEDELRDLEPACAREAIGLLERVLNEQRVLVEITDNYLRYARLPDLQPAAVDVNRTVGELVRFLRHELEREGIAVSASLADGLQSIQADRRLLRFVLMNLLKNASEAMGAGGRLRVRTAQQNGAVEIRVSDTGPGIRAEELEHVFEPFYTTKDAGSGLGLSLSRQIVEKHHGTLTCESMVGVGTTFTVRLPAGQAGGSGLQVPGSGDARSRGPSAPGTRHPAPGT